MNPAFIATRLFAAAAYLTEVAEQFDAGRRSPRELIDAYAHVMDVRGELIDWVRTGAPRPALYGDVLAIAGEALNLADDLHKAMLGEWVPYEA